MNNGMVIAIDGPVASGKGTVAPKLAQRVNGMHLYTGGTYRAVALFCSRNGIDIKNEEAVVSSLPNIHVDVDDKNIYLNQENVTEEIKKPEVASASSSISVYGKVREKMVDLQQQIAAREVEKGKIIIADGRDTGTRVFPQADIKIFLTATPEVRAERRMIQYKEKGIEKSFEEVLKETIERDTRDSERKTDPLVKEPEKFGYVVVDNSNQSQEATVDIIVEKIREKGISI